MSLTHVRFIRSTSDVDGVKIWMSLEISGFWMLWTKLDRELAEDYRARYSAINLVMDRATVLINHLESFSHVAPGRYTTFRNIIIILAKNPEEVPRSGCCCCGNIAFISFSNFKRQKRTNNIKILYNFTKHSGSLRW